MNRFLIAAPAAILLTAGIFVTTATPALANSETCATTSAQLRTVAATADAAAAKKALRNISIGEKLCEAGNDRAADKKFEVAMKTLNVDSASLQTAAAK